MNTSRRPMGWQEFLSAIAELNIPLSTVPNRRVKEEINSFKKTDTQS